MNSQFLMPWLISNSLALGLLWLAGQRPVWVRRLYGLGFIAAAAFNSLTALRNPGLYVEGFGPHAQPAYQDFIYGPFSQQPAVYVLLIAAGQLLCGILMLCPAPLARFGLLGAMIFLLAIAPLGLGSAFPATLLMLASLLRVYRRQQDLAASPRPAKAPI